MERAGEIKHGIVLPNWVVEGSAERLVEYGVAAESAGWDGVLLADHLIFPPAQPDDDNDGRTENQPFPDPWITLAGIATRTTEVRLGSWITPIPRRQPWQVARDLATLDRLSDGRVFLGAGLGLPHDYTKFGGEWNPRELGQKYDEALDVITGLWRGEPFSYDGDHYTVDDAVLLPTPVQEPRIPIIIGGVWPNKKPFHRGARWDGIVPHYRGDGVLPADGGGITAKPENEIEPEEEARAMLNYYHGLTDDPGEIFLPADPPHRSPEWEALCESSGVTWLYTRPRDESGEWELTMERIRRGPPT